jgi:hypothetical protein
MAFASGSYIKSPKEAWTCPTVNKTLPLCLCVISLLFGVIAEVTFLSSGARAQVDGIIVAGADDVSMITNEYSAEIANVTSGVTSRVVVEYGDFGSKLELNRSGELDQAASAVSSRVLVEYAGFVSNYESQSSDALLQAAANVTSRIIVEYADFIFSPSLGPKPIIDGTPPTIGTPVQEPPSDMVMPDTNVTVSVNITDAESGVKNATLRYNLNNTETWTTAVMSYDSTSHLYYATILNQSKGTDVKYEIVAYDNAENMAVKDNATHYYTYTVIPEFPSFFILPLFMIATLLAVIAYSSCRARKGGTARQKSSQQDQILTSTRACAVSGRLFFNISAFPFQRQFAI